MIPYQFDILVARLERQAMADPAGYRFQVMLLNAYVTAILLFLLILLLVLLASVTTFRVVAVKLAIIIGLFLWAILKALWVKIDPPSGIEVKAGESRNLFAMIQGLRSDLRAPRSHHVLVTDDFNAGGCNRRAWGCSAGREITS